MQRGKQTPLTTARAFLAGLVVLLLSLMSSGVGSCEISCLFNDSHCADTPTQAWPSTAQANFPSVEVAAQAADRLTSLIGPVGSNSGCDDEMCKDGSATAMLPAGNAMLQKSSVRWVAPGVIRLINWPAGERLLGSRVESPPPKAVGVNLLSMTLRI